MPSRTLIEKAQSALHLRLLALQRRIVARRTGAMIVIGGNDRLGGSELANQLTEWFDSRTVRICSPDTALAEIETKPFLWPYWQQAPAQGHLTIVVGDWTTRTALAATSKTLSGESLRQRLKALRSLEETLAANGTTLAKIWIETPEKSLRKRLRNAEDSDAEGWVVSSKDLLLTKGDGHKIARSIRPQASGKGMSWKVINGSDSKHRDLLAGRSILQQLSVGLRRKPAKVRKPSNRTRGLLESPTTQPVLQKKDYSQQISKLQNRLGRLTRIAAKRGLATVIALEGVDAAG